MDTLDKEKDIKKKHDRSPTRLDINSRHKGIAKKRDTFFKEGVKRTQRIAENTIDNAPSIPVKRPCKRHNVIMSSIC